MVMPRNVAELLYRPANNFAAVASTYVAAAWLDARRVIRSVGSTSSQLIVADASRPELDTLATWSTQGPVQLLAVDPCGDHTTGCNTRSTIAMADNATNTERLSGLQKAKNSDHVLFTRSTFRKCPDLWLSDTSFEKIYRVSNMNPQQDQYAWGNAELVHWKSSAGVDLDGILLKLSFK